LSRRLARQKAFQVLFQIDVGRTEPELAWQQVLQGSRLAGDNLEYARSLVQGALGHLEEIDGLISRHSFDWRLERMGNVDRNVLRLGVYELLYCPDLPAGVVINEAIELAKLYHDEEAGRFVNGILDAINKAYRSNE